MTDRAPSMLEYLMTLSPEEAAEAVKKLPLAERRLLISSMCNAVNDMAKAIVANSEEIWENR